MIMLFWQNLLVKIKERKRTIIFVVFIALCLLTVDNFRRLCRRFFIIHYIDTNSSCFDKWNCRWESCSTTVITHDHTVFACQFHIIYFVRVFCIYFTFLCEYFWQFACKIDSLLSLLYDIWKTEKKTKKKDRLILKTLMWTMNLCKKKKRCVQSLKRK